MKLPHFNPIKISPTLSIKLENIFLQKNNLCGFQYIIKDKTQELLTLHFQYNKKKQTYEQHIDGNIENLPEALVKSMCQQHTEYNFHDPNSNQSSKEKHVST